MSEEAVDRVDLLTRPTHAPARLARDCARCDGEPYCYKPALDESGAITAQLGEKTGPDVTAEAA